MQESNLILDYEDWAVYYNHFSNSFVWVDKITREWRYVELVATLHYDINSKPYDYAILTMFDDCCCGGERVTDNEIIYYWFKEIEE